MTRPLLALAAVVAGVLVVGPVLSHAVLRWIGSRGVVPLLLGWEPSRAEFAQPQVACRTCEAPLSLSRLPLFPWVGSLGRCRDCGEPIDRWVLGVEAITGAGFGAAAARFGWSIELLPMLAFIAGLVPISTVDVVCRRIPTRFVHVTGLGVTLSIGVAVLVEHEAASLVGAAIGAATCFTILGLQFLLALLLSGGHLGFGDVRLGSVIGLVLGWFGWVGWPPEDPHPALGSIAAVLTALIISSIMAALVGLVLRAVRGRGHVYPFGPWLSLGALITGILLA